MNADVLSDLLKTVRLTGAAFFDIVATAPWVAAPPREMILPSILPGADHLIAYHVVTDGRCVTTLIGDAPIELEAGEVIVFTKGDPHVMSSSPGMRADPTSPDVLEAVPRKCHSSSTTAARTRFLPGSSVATSLATRGRSIHSSKPCLW